MPCTSCCSRAATCAAMCQTTRTEWWPAPKLRLSCQSKQARSPLASAAVRVFVPNTVAGTKVLRRLHGP